MSLSAWIMWLISVFLLFGALIWFTIWLDRKDAKRRSAYEETHGEDIRDLKGTWRVGRHLGRTLYLQIGDKPSEDDVLLGMMDTVEAAQIVINAVNAKQGKEGPWTWTS